MSIREIRYPRQNKVTKLKFSVSLIFNVSSSLVSIVLGGVFLRFSDGVITSSNYEKIAGFEFYLVSQRFLTILFANPLRTLHLSIEERQ